MTPQEEEIRPFKPGPLAWMAQNAVAANLLMIILIVSGLIMSTRIQQEVFPEFDMEWVIIRVAYPGASPAEAEEIDRVLEKVKGYGLQE